MRLRTGFTNPKRFWTMLLPLAALWIAGLACSRADVSVTAAAVPTDLPTTEPTVLPTDPPVTPTPEPSPAATVTPTPGQPEVPVSPTPPPTPTLIDESSPETIVYQVQPGDTINSLSIRFAVLPEEIEATGGTLPDERSLLNQDQLLLIPRRLGPTGPAEKIIPDSEFVFSPHAVDFDPVAFARQHGGYLSNYQEYVHGDWHSGPEVVALAARDNSVNPRLLLAMLEYMTGWVTDPARPTGDEFTYPLGHKDPETMGLFRQLTWLANAMGEGYYSWRAGTLTEISFEDGTTVRLAPEINAGTAALQAFLATEMEPRAWAEAVSPTGLAEVYRSFFGDPWQYQHPLFEPGVRQPEMILPFLPGHIWAFTGGPHGAWEREAAWAALDFAPPSVESGCARSDEWVLAAAPGLVLRSGGGVVVLDLDGDGREQTGWVLIYLHIDSRGRVPAGSFVEQGDLIGHPSCEGGISTGTHVHIVRKYNGEWILADGPLPFEMSGWVARAGTKPYQGALVNGTDTILACPCASSETYIIR
ncbi:MAG: M23 family metallopeptidase [Anaerolineales bacterium]